MQRREFMQAAGALAGLGLLPSWRLFTQRKQIDLTPFCDDDYIGHRRYDLSKPFSQGGMAYGTDGRILCRTTLADVPELDEPTKLPACNEMPWWECDGKWQRWPNRRLFKDGSKYDSQCPMCLGKGGFEPLTLCVPCGGMGTVDLTNDELAEGEWDGGYEKDCPTCKGTRWTSPNRCDYCEGRGWTHKPTLQRIGSLVVAGHYDSIVRALGEVEFLIISEPRGRLYTKPTEKSVVKFRGDGFEGLLMPIDMDWRKTIAFRRLEGKDG